MSDALNDWPLLQRCLAWSAQSGPQQAEPEQAWHNLLAILQREFAIVAMVIVRLSDGQMFIAPSSSSASDRTGPSQPEVLSSWTINASLQNHLERWRGHAVATVLTADQAQAFALDTLLHGQHGSHRWLLCAIHQAPVRRSTPTVSHAVLLASLVIPQASALFAAQAVLQACAPLLVRSIGQDADPWREIHDLADVQRALQPEGVQGVGLQVLAHFQPSLIVGGDYYDLAKLSHRNSAFQVGMRDVMGCMIADVSGHGAAAAMETVQFDAILRTYKGDEGPGPAAALSYANRHYFSRRSRGRFMTALALLFIPHEGVVRYVSAGHPPFFHISKNGVVQRGMAEDLAIGILREHRYENRELAYIPGERFVLLTDGLPEARNEQAQELGMQALHQVVEQFAHAPLADLQQAILRLLHQHQNGPVGRDDQTLLVIEIAA